MDKCLNAWHPPKRLNALTPPPLPPTNVWMSDPIMAGQVSCISLSLPCRLHFMCCESMYVFLGMVLVSHEHSMTSHDITWHHITSYNIIWHHGSTVHKQWKYLYLSNWSEMQNSYLVQSRDVKILSWHKLVPNVITEPPDITLHHIVSHCVTLDVIWNHIT